MAPICSSRRCRRTPGGIPTSTGCRARPRRIRSCRSAPMVDRAARTMPVTSPADDRRGRSAGFALYELILALAVLGLVAAIIFPRLIRPPGPAELRAKALEVAALLRSDRNAALREQREILSRIDLTRNAV